MNVNELRHAVQKGLIEPVYLLEGPELGEKKEIIDLLLKQLSAHDDPEVSRFYCGSDFRITDFTDVLQGALLFSSTKIIILKSIEAAGKDLIKVLTDFLIPPFFSTQDFNEKILGKLGPADREKIGAFYQQGDRGYTLKKIKENEKKKVTGLLENCRYNRERPDTYVIMLNETTDRIPESLTRLLTAKQRIMFWEMFENKKQEWIISRFKSAGMQIEKEAVLFILQTIENNKEYLENEISKIIAVFSALRKEGEQSVRKEFIEEYLFHSKEENAFSLFSAMMKKDLPGSMQILEKVFILDEFSLLFGLLFSFRRLLKVFDLYHNQKKSSREIYSQLFIKSKKIQAEMDLALDSFSLSHIVESFYHLSELDYYLKILPTDLKKIKLEQFILFFLGENNHKSFLQGPLQFLQY